MIANESTGSIERREQPCRTPRSGKSFFRHPNIEDKCKALLAAHDGRSHTPARVNKLSQYGFPNVGRFHEFFLIQSSLLHTTITLNCHLVYIK
jgi:hypothetical protein